MGKKKSGAAEGSSTKSSPNFANSPMGHRTHWNLETDVEYGKSLGVGTLEEIIDGRNLCGLKLVCSSSSR